MEKDHQTGTNKKSEPILPPTNDVTAV
jgi:hypothetical protein